MRVLLPCLVACGLLATCGVFAQDDDGWGEITSLMNAVANANRQLQSKVPQQGLNQGLYGRSGTTGLPGLSGRQSLAPQLFGQGLAGQQVLGQQYVGGSGGLSPGFMQGLSAWCQAYARVLQSVDGAFGDGTPGGYDPFAAGAANPLQQQFDLWQRAMSGAGAQGAAQGQTMNQYLPQLNSLYNAYNQFE